MKARKPSRVWLYTILAIFSLFLSCYVACLITIGVLNAGLKSRPDDLPPSFCQTMDTEAPKIVLDGEPNKTLLVGEVDTPPEVTVTDDCDEVELETNGEVDTNKVGEYVVSYEAVDNSGNIAKMVRKVRVIPEYRGTIYLTFDDGPGPYTAELLDVLKKYGVKATFFVTGRGDDSLILREYNEGHTVGLHTFSHNYATIYRSVDAFFEDLYAIQNRVKNITGETATLMRFPGGSSNTVSARYDGRTRIMSQLVKEVEKRGFTYFDWNISSGDAERVVTSDGVVDRVVNALKEGGDSVVLQHDIKDFSVQAVERIIQYGLDNGYKFERLNASSYTAHHGVNN